jgi:small GTP-binding protein
MEEPKVIMVGNTSAGKTTLLLRLRDNEFHEGESATIAGFCATISFDLGSPQSPAMFTFQLWDTAGQERYRSLTPVYSRDAHVVLLVYDVTSRASFEGVREWHKLVKGNTHPNCRYLIVGTKCDRENEDAIADSEGDALQEQIQAEGSCRISSKTGSGIDALVRTVQIGVEKCLAATTITKSGIVLTQVASKKKAGLC